MKTIRSFNVVPMLPEKLLPLRELAYNVWWAWDHESQELFMRIDPKAWQESNHNPVKLLALVNAKRLRELAEDVAFVSHLERVIGRFHRYLETAGWYKNVFPKEQALVAYFSAEFGITESLPIYSGGLGVLAGDHLKAASDLGLPLVGVGLLYRSGYFTQSLNADGWQQESYIDNEWSMLPVSLVRIENGEPLTVTVEYPEGNVLAYIWRVNVGRVPLILLDTNIAANNKAARDITAQLYAGDRELRIRQELLLGVGGLRAMKAMGYNPTVCHMNEGHPAFLALERICEHMEEHKLSFLEAKEAVAAGNVFTTHTPVPAGNDEFAPALTERYLKPWQLRMAVPMKDFLALGRRNPIDASETFCMTVLAIRLSSYRNGVSKLHGVVSRKMWQCLFPGVPEDDVPVGSVTNGVHFHTWISRDMAGLYERYLGPVWHEDPDDHAVWERVEQIPDEELWMTHERRRERLVAYTRKRLIEQFEKRGATRADIKAASEALQPDALTIGFARRFASYKRGTLLLRNLDRLEQLITNQKRPVQIIIAGKAHPRDDEGKHLIRQIIHTLRRPALKSRFVFIEDYDIDVARRLVQGADIWLNTPRRPLEASGTSGMKAAANGVLNLSILDGWWAEAYQRDIGWAIGKGEEYTDLNYQDDVESTAIYDLLEKEIVPLFYNRGEDGMPREWISRMKQSIKVIGPGFSANRMVEEYCKKAYLPVQHQYQQFKGNGFAKAKALSQWKEGMLANFGQITLERVEADIPREVMVNHNIPIKVFLQMGPVGAQDVAVEVLYGHVDTVGELKSNRLRTVLASAGKEGNLCKYEGTISCTMAGKMGFTVRVIPRHDDLMNPFDLARINWAAG